MSDALNAAIEELQTQLQKQLDAAQETKRTINSLRRTMGLEPLYADGSPESAGATRPDQYYGKAFATAAQEYLDRRKQATGAEEIMRGLESGGFDFDALGWKEKTRARNVAISLAKNTQKFHKLPNGTFGLLGWYDQATIRKAREDRPRQSEEESSEVGSSSEET